MSVSKRFVSNPRNVKRVRDLYLHDTQKPTVREVAKLTGTTFHNVSAILQANVEPEVLRREQALRYSRSKTAEKNPMTGRSGSRHHNFIGDVEDGKGYLQRKVDGRYVYVHRIVMAEALGLSSLPREFAVHHINGDKKDNRLNNLALVTHSGHMKLHACTPPSPKSTLWEQWVSGTSK